MRREVNLLYLARWFVSATALHIVLLDHVANNAALYT